ncbi:hypothetical protein ACIRPX_35385 [Streptomyces sp. NPDC101225]|uniref:hypothetical protein n=1 Tax=Streptomyces sp. NPDC101225 TaxID=3366135 RepID=UPI003801A13E
MGETTTDTEAVEAPAVEPAAEAVPDERSRPAGTSVCRTQAVEVPLVEAGRILETTMVETPWSPGRVTRSCRRSNTPPDEHR